MCGTLCGMDRGPVPVTPREKDIEKYTREKAAQEYAARESALKRSASDKDDMISFLRQANKSKMAKFEYIEQTPAKFVFQCWDGDIQIPEYGLLRSDFYYQERMNLSIRLNVLITNIYGHIDVDDAYWRQFMSVTISRCS